MSRRYVGWVKLPQPHGTPWAWLDTFYNTPPRFWYGQRVMHGRMRLR